MKRHKRNDRCPCGSGLKYKKCCLDKHQQEEFNTFRMSDLVTSSTKSDAIHECGHLIVGLHFGLTPQWVRIGDFRAADGKMVVGHTQWVKTMMPADECMCVSFGGIVASMRSHDKSFLDGAEDDIAQIVRDTRTIDPRCRNMHDEDVLNFARHLFGGQTLSILHAHREVFDTMVSALMEKKCLNHSDIMDIWNRSHSQILLAS